MKISELSYHGLMQYCKDRLIPTTFETCDGCDKVYHPHDTRPGRCMCGHLDQKTTRRFPRSMLETYINSVKGVFKW